MTNSLRSSLGANRQELPSPFVARVDAAKPTTEGAYAASNASNNNDRDGGAVLDVQERCVALQLDQANGAPAGDDRVDVVTGMAGAAPDLAPGEVRGVAGQIGEDQEAGLGVSLP